MSFTETRLVLRVGCIPPRPCFCRNSRVASVPAVQCLQIGLTFHLRPECFFGLRFSVSLIPSCPDVRRDAPVVLVTVKAAEECGIIGFALHCVPELVARGSALSVDLVCHFVRSRFSIVLQPRPLSLTLEI